ncbi:MAG: hypothetical protein WC292_07170 [Clostridia bacterium]
MKKNLITKILVAVIVSVFAVFAYACDVASVTSIEFETIPPNAFLLNDDMPEINLTVKFNDNTTSAISTTSGRIAITGFSTENVGIFTATLSYRGANLVWTYRVVESNLLDAYFASGNGNTEATAYEITNAVELANMNRVFEARPEDYVYYKITSHIDLANIEWQALGTIEMIPDSPPGYVKVTVVSGFYGQLDGGNYEIRNFKRTGDMSGASMALFMGSMDSKPAEEKYLDRSVVKNLKIPNVDINITNEANYSAGILFSSAYNIDVNNVIVSGTVTSSGSYTLGGIASLAGNATFEDCVNSINLTSNYGSGGIVGGITGWVITNRGDTDYINCVNNGTITSTRKTSLGAIVGHAYLRNDFKVTIDSCKNTAKNIFAGVDFGTGNNAIREAYQRVVDATGNLTIVADPNPASSGASNTVLLGNLELSGNPGEGAIKPVYLGTSYDYFAA